MARQQACFDSGDRLTRRATATFLSAAALALLGVSALHFALAHVQGRGGTLALPCLLLALSALTGVAGIAILHVRHQTVQVVLVALIGLMGCVCAYLPVFEGEPTMRGCLAGFTACVWKPILLCLRLRLRLQIALALWIAFHEVVAVLFGELVFEIAMPVTALVFSSVAGAGCIFLTWQQQSRPRHLSDAERQLSQEKEATTTLLSMVFDGTCWVAADGDTVLRSDRSFNFLMRHPSMEGSRLSGCTPTEGDERSRLAEAFATRSPTAGAKTPVALFPTTLLTGESTTEVNLLIVAVADHTATLPARKRLGFLVGVKKVESEANGSSGPPRNNSGPRAPKLRPISAAKLHYKNDEGSDEESSVGTWPGSEGAMLKLQQSLCQSSESGPASGDGLFLPPKAVLLVMSAGGTLVSQPATALRVGDKMHAVHQTSFVPTIVTVVSIARKTRLVLQSTVRLSDDELGPGTLSLDSSNKLLIRSHGSRFQWRAPKDLLTDGSHRPVIFEQDSADVGFAPWQCAVAAVQDTAVKEGAVVEGVFLQLQQVNVGLCARIDLSPSSPFRIFAVFRGSSNQGEGSEEQSCEIASEVLTSDAQSTISSQLSDGRSGLSWGPPLLPMAAGLRLSL